MTIAFIGLGNMGGPMAANLVKAGFSVVGTDPSAEACERCAKDGVTIVDSAEAAVADADTVITMLPNGALVLSVYDQVLGAAKPGTLFIDCSTIAVADAREAATRADAAGHRAVDAPVSGGVGGAAAGTLTFMVGGSDADVEAARPVLEPMAGKVVHCGEVGAGQAAKVCNNLILGISMVAVSEAFVLGERLGLTHQALYDVASVSSGQCWSLTTYCPVPGPVPTSPANNDYRPGFAAALMNKDLGLALEAIGQTGVDAQVGALTAQLYQQLTDTDGGKDFSAVIQQIRDASAPAGDQEEAR